MTRSTLVSRPAEPSVPRASTADKKASSTLLADRVRRTEADLHELNKFYSIDIAPRRYEALVTYHREERVALGEVDFGSLDQEGRVDYILLKIFHTRQLNELKRQRQAHRKLVPLLPFADTLVALLEARQDMKPLDAPTAADTLSDAGEAIAQVHSKVKSGGFSAVTETTGYLAAKAIAGLLTNLQEWSAFYVTYDPQYDYWVAAVWESTYAGLSDYLGVVQRNLAGMKQKEGSRDDAIVGEPIGRTGLLAELEAEMIPYTPEELLEIADCEFQWCECEIIKQAMALGYGADWKVALEQVKNDYVEPGRQTDYVKQLVDEGAAFVVERDLVTVPALARSTWRMSMIATEQQKVSPFFLGGPTIQVSYPTAAMDQDLKRMVLRGNNRHYARATAFHEMFPGHRLQLYMADRHNSHRKRLFDTPFYVEGWALYWEFLLYARGDFHRSPQNRIGALFWRMHRCLRIVFSLKFHLGAMTAQEAVDLLVDKIHHERSNAEGEVRRSVEGSYSPLYQAGYMLGALQLWKLREMVVDTGRLSEKEFHDTILRTNAMPIEMVKALLLGDELSPDFTSKWKFYDF